jgi:Protein of unknown function (DUF3606)
LGSRSDPRAHDGQLIGRLLRGRRQPDGDLLFPADNIVSTIADKGMRLASVLAEGGMAMDLNETFADRRIHTDDDCYDLMYWSIKFGVSVEQLVDAVAKVGPLVTNVERQLRLSATVVADPSAANPDRYLPQFHGQWAAGPTDYWIIIPDTTAFLVRNDEPYLFHGHCGVERPENDPSFVTKAHETQRRK